MSDYVISCCSTADLTKEHFEKRNISYICFHYELNGKEYADDLGQSMPFDQFYKAMQDGASTKTSQVNADEFEEYFEGFLKEGKDVLHVCLSSGISGVINSANVAKADLEEKYPGRKILVVDSLGASSGYGLFMDKLADLRDEGRPIEEVHAWAEEHKLNLHHWFFSTDLTFYIRGGRISKASGFFGLRFGLGNVQAFHTAPVGIGFDLGGRCLREDVLLHGCVSTLLTFANQFVGKVPYVSGGNTPSGWDCSGFVQYVYGQMGVSLPHYSGAQATVGRAVGSLADAQPGDIIANAQHAAIYVGNGMVINSQLNGTRYDPIAWVFPSSYSIRRIF